MTKEWYPLVDSNRCTACGVCLSFAQCGTFLKGTNGKPEVVAPENCANHCHGCGNRCVAGAITYAGDDTGWIPPALRPAGANMDDVY